MTNDPTIIEEVLSFYNNLLNSILPENIGFFRVDENGKFLYVDKNWCRIAGVTFDEAINKHWIDFSHPEDSLKLNDSWNMNTVFLKEYFRIPRGDSKDHWVKCCIKHVNAPINGFIGLVIEITNNVDLLNELLDIKSELRQIPKKD